MLEKHTKLETPIKAILKELNIDYSEKFIAELREILERGHEHIKPYPETMQVLESLKKKYKLGMITNTNFFSFSNLDSLFQVRKIFDAILTSYETNLLKPDPKLFKLMLKKLEVKENEVIIVGDSLEDDVKSAENIGIRGILIDRRSKHPSYKGRIISLDQIKNYLEANNH